MFLNHILKVILPKQLNIVEPPIAPTSTGFDPVGAGFNIAGDIFTSFINLSSKKEQAKIEGKTLSEQIELFNKQRGQLEEAFAAKSRLLTKTFGRREFETRGIFGTQRKGFQRQKEDISSSIRRTAAKTGFAFSGTVEDIGERRTEDLRLGVEEANKRFQSNLSQLQDTLSSAQFQNISERDRVLSDIDITLAGLEGQKQAAKARSEEKFLGIF